MLPNRGADVRISDAERDRVIAFLRQSCGDGLLTLDEFSDRVGDVYASRTSSELERVTADLPFPTTTPDGTAGSTPSRRRRAVRWTISFLSGNSQKGRWRIEAETTAISFMGGCELDLRHAEVVGDHAVINAVAFMGGVDIVVPEGIEVVMNVIPFMGGRSCRVKRVPVIPGSPVIEVRGLAFMGGVSVRSKSNPDDTRSRLGPSSHRHEPHARKPLPPKQAGIERVTGTVQSEWRTLHSHVAPDGTVTIMFSDIEGYTSMVERLGDNKAQQVLRAHNDIIRRQVEGHGGFEVKVQGDGFMLAFSSAARALRCAVAIQRDFAAYNEEHPDEPLKVRMGLHTGEAIRDADDFLGTTVILASRIASSASGGQIFVSSLLRELCTSSGEFSFDGGIEVELKGMSRPHRVFAVDWQQPAQADG